MKSLFRNIKPEPEDLTPMQKGMLFIEETAKKSTREGQYRLEEITLHDKGYAEPGYKETLVALGNWNDITDYKNGKSVVKDTGPSLVSEELEKLGFELEWNDEWTVCDQCGKLVRTQANSYSWQRYYYEDENDCEVVCGDCVKEDPTEYLASLEGKDNACLTIEVDLTEHGYVLLEEGFENGFHPGQDASPELIANALREQGIERFIFNLDSVGQFDMDFSVYVHKSEMKKLDKGKWSGAKKMGPSVSEGAKKALQDASEKMGKLTGPGVKVANCDVTTGKAKVKLVSQEDFIKGKGLK